MHWVSEGFGAKIESLHFYLRAAEAHLWQGSGAVMMGRSVGLLCGDRLEGRGLETGGKTHRGVASETEIPVQRSGC